MFIVVGAVLGTIFLREPVTLRRVLGIARAVLSVYLMREIPRAGVRP